MELPDFVTNNCNLAFHHRFPFDFSAKWFYTFNLLLIFEKYYLFKMMKSKIALLIKQGYVGT